MTNSKPPSNSSSKVANQLMKAKVYLESGAIERNTNNFDLAMENCNKGLAIFSQYGKKEGIEQGLNLKACILNDLGKNTNSPALIHEAIILYHQVYEINSELGNKHRIAITLGNLGNAHQRLKEYGTALDYLRQALALNREIGNRRSEGINLVNMGNIFRNTGQYDQALVLLKQALEANRSVENHIFYLAALHNIVETYADLGEYQTARSYLHQMRDIHRSNGNREEQGKQLARIANLHIACGEYIIANKLLKQAIQLYQEVGYHRGEGIELGNLGYNLYRINQIEAAEKYLINAIEILNKYYPPPAEFFNGVLAHLYAIQGSVEIAIQMIGQGEEQIRTQPSEYGEFICLKAEIFRISGDRIESDKALQQAVHIQQQLTGYRAKKLHQKIEKTKHFLESPFAHQVNQES